MKKKYHENKNDNDNNNDNENENNDKNKNKNELRKVRNIIEQHLSHYDVSTM